MSTAPFASLTESFLEDKFGIIEGTMTFEAGETWDYGYGGETFSRNVFTIYVYGLNTEGLNTVFEDGAAAQLLDEMFAWRGSA
jgi:hypothetical protein